MAPSRFVRCKDNTLARDVLSIGHVYEVGGEEHSNYWIAGRWFSVGRFAPATLEDWQAQR